MGDNDDDLSILSWRQIKESGGPSKWQLKRAADRGEIKITKLSYNRSGVRASEYRKYLDKRTG